MMLNRQRSVGSDFGLRFELHATYEISTRFRLLALVSVTHLQRSFHSATGSTACSRRVQHRVLIFFTLHTLDRRTDPKNLLINQHLQVFS